jgi:hypothetical protein
MDRLCVCDVLRICGACCLQLVGLVLRCLRGAALRNVYPARFKVFVFKHAKYLKRPHAFLSQATLV